MVRGRVNVFAGKPSRQRGRRRETRGAEGPKAKQCIRTFQKDSAGRRGHGRASIATSRKINWRGGAKQKHGKKTRKKQYELL